MSVFGRGRHRETDAPGWDDEHFAFLGDKEPAPSTVARRPVEGSPPWPVKDVLPPADDVAAGHNANWQPQPPRGTTWTPGEPVTGDSIDRMFITAGFEAAEPVEFTARVEPSEPLARARELLAGDPTFGWALRHAPLADLAALFDPEATDGE